MKFVHQVEWAPANLIVNSSDVFTQQSHADELDAAQKENSEQRSNMSRARYYAEILQVKHGVTQIHQREKQREGQYSYAQDQSQPQRLIAEAEDRVHGVF